MKFIMSLNIPNLNIFNLISELTTKGTKDNIKANFNNIQSAQKNKNQRFLKLL